MQQFIELRVEIVSYAKIAKELGVSKTTLINWAKDCEPEAYAVFSQNYGFDVTRWPGYPTLRAVRELTMVTWLMQIINVTPEHRSEFDHRVASMRDGRQSEFWHAL